MANQPAPAAEWITREEAAEMLGVNIRTIDRRIRLGEIRTKRPRVIRGRNAPRIYVNVEDLKALAADETPAE